MAGNADQACISVFLHSIVICFGFAGEEDDFKANILSQLEVAGGKQNPLSNIFSFNHKRYKCLRVKEPDEKFCTFTKAKVLILV